MMDVYEMNRFTRERFTEILKLSNEEILKANKIDARREFYYRARKYILGKFAWQPSYIWNNGWRNL